MNYNSYQYFGTDTPMAIDAEKRKEKPEKMKEEPDVKEANPPKEPPPSKGASGGGGWWSGWGMSNLSNLSSVVHNTTNIVQKSVQSTSNIVQKSVSIYRMYSIHVNSHGYTCTVYLQYTRQWYSPLRLYDSCFY